MPGIITPGGRIGDPSPVGTPGGKQNWVDRAGGLPTYIRMVAHALMRRGHSESSAIATAVATMKRWAAGGGNVSAKVQAAAAAAIAEFEAKRGVGSVGKSNPLDSLRAEATDVGKEMLTLIAKKKLTASARKKIKPKNFALPGGRYPIHDEDHARAALSMVAQHGTPEEQKKVRAAVKRKYPNIEISKSSHVPGTPYRYKHGWIKVSTGGHVAQVGNHDLVVLPKRGSSHRWEVKDRKQQFGAKVVARGEASTVADAKRAAEEAHASVTGSSAVVMPSTIGSKYDNFSTVELRRELRTKHGIAHEGRSRAEMIRLLQSKIQKSEMTEEEFDQLLAEFESEIDPDTHPDTSIGKVDGEDATLIGEISKVDEEKRLVFGWASVGVRADGQVVLDKQGDVIDSPDEMEQAAYNFVLHKRDGGEMHIRKGVSTLVESFVITPEKRKILGIPDGVLPQLAWWTGWKVHDDNVWKAAKSGKYKMFSVHGRGTRKAI